MAETQRHKCLVCLDDSLAEKNTRLGRDVFRVNRVYLATERIVNFRDGKTAEQVFCIYCPVCGNIYCPVCGKKLAGVV